MYAQEYKNILYKINSRDGFLSVTLDSLCRDRVQLELGNYNAEAEKGDRLVRIIRFYLPVYEAQVLAGDILSGQIAKLGQMTAEKATTEGKEYPDPVYTRQGGTSSQRSKTGQAVGRTLELSVGKKAPWVFTAKQGPAHETSQGLIVLDKAEDIVCVPVQSEGILKEFAYALQDVKYLWLIEKFEDSAHWYSEYHERPQRSWEENPEAEPERN